MKVLAIETSCDETGIALVEGRRRDDEFEFVVHKAALLSQAQLHAPYGGVYPNLAKREHQKNLPALFAEFESARPDALAVTAGPGLEPALWTGITFAQELAQRLGKPLFAVNHMEAHLISSLARHSLGDGGAAKPAGEHSYILKNVRMSVLGLLISGGHTQFVHMRDYFQYQIIGETLDDAVGEAFDKVARMLGLPYPGGPEISKHASAAREKKLVSEIKLPRPMLHADTCDVSFSGLKTAALYALRGRSTTLTASERAAFAAEFEEAVGDIFVVKTRRALSATGAQTFVIGGGVAANRYLRERLQQLVLDEFPDVELRLPHAAITGDNAVMIAEAALCHLLTGDWEEPPKEIRAKGNLSIVSTN
jgi:N6-L-threonylcarbamoyladenine synthase